ncbi:MAG: UMP kinase [Clostridia bacterium]|nr:UMP kinase [Clostridia bacterium]
MKSIYKRVLIKISGEAMAGDQKQGINEDVITKLCLALKKAVEETGVEIAIVVGGGNFWRGAKNPAFDRSDADHMGMLATVMNAIALKDKLRQLGVPAVAMSAIEMNAICELYVRAKADEYLRSGKIVILGCGTGSPFFTTDTGAALRAAQLSCDAILLAKNIDGVYDSDPAMNPGARKYDRISMSDVLAQNLKVMDLTATAFCLEHDMPLSVFEIRDPENVLRVLSGEKIGTEVYCG